MAYNNLILKLSIGIKKILILQKNKGFFLSFNIDNRCNMSTKIPKKEVLYQYRVPSKQVQYVNLHFPNKLYCCYYILVII